MFVFKRIVIYKIMIQVSNMRIQNVDTYKQAYIYQLLKMKIRNESRIPPYQNDVLFFEKCQRFLC